MTASIPTPREHLAAASDGRFVYVVGGRALSPDKNTAAVERYDPERDRWTAACPTCRRPAAAFRPRSWTAISSRSAASVRPTVLGDIESYNIASGTWSTRVGHAHATPRDRRGGDRSHALLVRGRAPARPRERGVYLRGARAQAPVALQQRGAGVRRQVQQRIRQDAEQDRRGSRHHGDRDRDGG